MFSFPTRKCLCSMKHLNPTEVWGTLRMFSFPMAEFLRTAASSCETHSRISCMTKKEKTHTSHTHAYRYTHIRTYCHAHTRIYTHRHVYTHVHMCTHAHIHMNAHTYTIHTMHTCIQHTHAHTYAHVHTNMCAHKHTYTIYIWIHAYIRENAHMHTRGPSPDSLPATLTITEQPALSYPALCQATVNHTL